MSSQKEIFFGYFKKLTVIFVLVVAVILLPQLYGDKTELVKAVPLPGGVPAYAFELYSLNPGESTPGTIIVVLDTPDASGATGVYVLDGDGFSETTSTAGDASINLGMSANQAWYVVFDNPVVTSTQTISVNIGGVDLLVSSTIHSGAEAVVDLGLGSSSCGDGFCLDNAYSGGSNVNGASIWFENGYFSTTTANDTVTASVVGIVGYDLGEHITSVSIPTWCQNQNDQNNGCLSVITDISLYNKSIYFGDGLISGDGVSGEALTTAGIENSVYVTVSYSDSSPVRIAFVDVNDTGTSDEMIIIFSTSSISQSSLDAGYSFEIGEQTIDSSHYTINVDKTNNSQATIEFDNYYDFATSSFVISSVTLYDYNDNPIVIPSVAVSSVPYNDSGLDVDYGLDVPLSAPSAPENLSVAPVSASQINLSWDAVTSATSYVLYSATTSEFFVTTTVTTTVLTSYSDTGLATATEYYYKVSAVNDSGESSPSSMVSTSTLSFFGDSPVCLNDSCTYDTIADAFASSTFGDTITVGATYVSSSEVFNLDLGSYNLTLQCEEGAIIGTDTDTSSTISLRAGIIQNCTFNNVAFKLVSTAVLQNNIINYTYPVSSLGGTRSILVDAPSGNVAIVSNTVNIYYTNSNSGFINRLLGVHASGAEIVSNTFNYLATWTEPLISTIWVQSTSTLIQGNYFQAPATMSTTSGFSFIYMWSYGSMTVDHNTFDLGGCVGVGEGLNYCYALGVGNGGGADTGDLAVTSTYNVFYSGAGVPTNKYNTFIFKNDNTYITSYYHDYNGSYGLTEGYFSWGDYTNNIVSSTGGYDVTTDPDFKRADVDTTNDLELAPFSAYLDVNGDTDIGAYSGTHISTTYIDDDGTVDYSSVHATSTDVIASLRDNDTANLAAGTYNSFTINTTTLLTGNLTITGAGADTIINVSTNASSIDLNGINTSTIQNLVVQNASSTLLERTITPREFTGYEMEGTILVANGDVCGEGGVGFDFVTAGTPFSAITYDPSGISGWNIALVDTGDGSFITVYVADNIAATSSELCGGAFTPIWIDAWDYVDGNYGAFINNTTSTPVGGDPVMGAGNTQYFSGIKFTNSSNNTISNVTSTGNTYGVWFSGTSNENIVSSSIISDSLNYDVYSDATSDNNFFNVDYQITSSSVGVGSVLNLVQARVFVTSTNGAVEGVPITFTDNHLWSTEIPVTGVDGYTDYNGLTLFDITSSTDGSDATTTSSYNPYTIFAEAITGYSATSTEVDLSYSNYQTFTLLMDYTGEGEPPAGYDLPTVPSDAITKLIRANNIYYLFFTSTTVEGIYEVYLTTSTSGLDGTWSEPGSGIFSDLAPLSQGRSVDIQYNTAGNYFGIFAFTSSTSRIVFTTSSNAVSWSSPVTTTDPGGIWGPTVSFKFLPGTNYVVGSWVSGGGNVYLSSNGGSSWSTTDFCTGNFCGGDSLLPVSYYLDFLDVGISGTADNHVLHAGFYYSTSTNDVATDAGIMYASSTNNGTTWTTSTVVGDLANDVETVGRLTQMTVDGNGLPGFVYGRILGFVDDDPNFYVTTSMHYAHKASNGVWTTSTLGNDNYWDVSGDGDLYIRDLNYFATNKPVVVYAGDGGILKMAVNTSTEFSYETVTSTAVSVFYKPSFAYVTSTETAAITYVIGNQLYFSSSSLPMPSEEEPPSAGGNLSIVMPANTNLFGAENASWTFNVTTSEDLVAGDVVQFRWPFLDQADNYHLQDSVFLSTSTNITLYQNYNPFDGGTGVNDLQMYGNQGEGDSLFGYVDETIPAGTEFTATIAGISNPYPRGGFGEANPYDNILMRVKAGTPTNEMEPFGALTEKVNATTTFGLVQLGDRIVSDYNSNITASSYATNTIAEYTFSFTATSSIPVDGKVVLVFPEGFDISGAYLSDTININNSSTPAQVLTNAVATSTANGMNRVILGVSNVSTSPGDAITATIEGIINPVAKGVYRGLFVYTAVSNGGLIDGSFGGFNPDDYSGPPPVDTIHIGGDNTVVVEVYKEENGVRSLLAPDEAALMKIGMDCPDKQFYVGDRYLNASSSARFENLLDCNYNVWINSVSTDKSVLMEFMQNYLPPNRKMIRALGGSTATGTLAFGVPDATLTFSLDNLPADYSAEQGMINVNAYSDNYEGYSPVFTNTSYNTPGTNGSGQGFARINVKQGETWKPGIEGGTLYVGGKKYWPPNIPAVYIGTSTVEAGDYSYVLAENNLTVLLRNSADNSVVNDACVSVQQVGSGDFMGRSQDQTCNPNSGSNYLFKVPQGPVEVNVERHGGKTEKQIVSVGAEGATTTIYLAAPENYILATVIDSEGNEINGAGVFAHGSGGNANGVTNANGTTTLYVGAGVYTVDAFVPGFANLTPTTTVVGEGENAEVTFVVDASGFKVISGRVYYDNNDNEVYDQGTDTAVAGVKMFANTNGNGGGAETADDGAYSIYVNGNGTYEVGGWSRDTGRLDFQVVVLDESASGVDWALGESGTLEVELQNASQLDKLFIGIFNPTTQRGSHSGSWSTDGTSKKTSINLPAGNYRLDIGSPSGPIVEGQDVVVTGGETTNLIYNATAEITWVTVSGTVTLDSSPVDNATVWLARRAGPGFYSTQTDSNGEYSMVIPGNRFYLSGVEYNDYIANEGEVEISLTTNDEEQNFTLVSAPYTISGELTNTSHETLIEGWVEVGKMVNGREVRKGSPVDASGNYNINVTAGDWRVVGNSPCYYRSQGQNVTVSDSSVDAPIELTAMPGCNADAGKFFTIIDTNGGQIVTNDAIINIPANALGTSGNAVNLKINRTGLSVGTSNATPIVPISINATDSDGSSITSLNSPVEITYKYNESNLPIGFAEANLAFGYFSDATGQWESVAGTVDTVNNTVTVQVEHLTDFGPLLPGVPGAPENLVATPTSSSQIDLSWNDVVNTDYYIIYATTTDSAGLFYEGDRLTTTSYAYYYHTDLDTSTTWYYEVAGYNENGEGANSETASSTTLTGGTSFDGNLPTIPGDISNTKLLRVNNLYYLFFTSTTVTSSFNLYLTTSTNGVAGTWSEPQIIFSEMPVFEMDQAIATFGAEYNSTAGYLAFSAISSSTGHIIVATSTNGVAWGQVDTGLVGTYGNIINGMSFASGTNFGVVAYDFISYLYSTDNWQTINTSTIPVDPIVGGFVSGINAYYSGSGSVIVQAVYGTTATTTDFIFITTTNHVDFGTTTLVTGLDGGIWNNSFAVDSNGNAGFVYVTSSVAKFLYHNANGSWSTSNLGVGQQVGKFDLQFFNSAPYTVYTGTSNLGSFAYSTSSPYTFTEVTDIGGDQAIGQNAKVSTVYDDTTNIVATVFPSASNTMVFVTTSLDLAVSESDTLTVTGTVSYYDGLKNVTNATVLLLDSASTTIAVTTTDSNGLYTFNNVTSSQDYYIKISTSTLPSTSTRGVSSMDQTKIGRHLVGLETFSSVYKKIAADVNWSGGISSMDQTKIGRFIVGIETSPISGVWQFYSSDTTPTTTVSDSNYYRTVSTARFLNNPSTNQGNQDFT
ncbi:MAG TPA: hypothetical protein DEB09_04860, partial [Candidatus Magasanikbacteria bacterium]|nr:hypothetical protein [Candidatus Magasanikbacteria bacterium]